MPLLYELMVIALIIVVFWSFNERSQVILRKWAEANGFEIIHKQRHWFSRGRFEWWTTGRNQSVFSFTARDREGQERSGWARCGSFWGGVFFSDQIEIRWD